jgi:hypothetical protein
MRKIRVFSKQLIYQTWEYEVEVEDDFKLEFVPSVEQSRYLLDKIYNEGIEGHCLNDDEVRDEQILDYEEMGA